jgi:hypothetical protein
MTAPVVRPATVDDVGVILGFIRARPRTSGRPTQ